MLTKSSQCQEALIKIKYFQDSLILVVSSFDNSTVIFRVKMCVARKGPYQPICSWTLGAVRQFIPYIVSDRSKITI
jgi:hypothetical protein